MMDWPSIKQPHVKASATGMPDPRLTIVIPTFNRPEMLTRALIGNPVEEGEKPVLLDSAAQTKAIGQIVALDKIVMVPGDVLRPLSIVQAIKANGVSRIVPRLREGTPVSVPRFAVDVVVTPGDPPVYVFDATRPESRVARMVVDAALQRARGRVDAFAAREHRGLDEIRPATGHGRRGRQDTHGT